MTNEEIKVRPKGRLTGIFSTIPWTLLLIAYMVIVHWLNVGMSGAAGYVFIGLCVAVLLVEFIKSGDIGAMAFLIDLSGSIASLIISTALLCYLLFKLQQSPTFFHWLGFGIILGDVIISPFNAFRTALRNIGVGVPS